MNLPASLDPPAPRAMALSPWAAVLAMAAIVGSWALFAFLLSWSTGVIAPIWYANGAAIAMLHLRPAREWPQLLVAVLVADLLVGLLVVPPSWWSVLVLPARLAEVALGAFLVRRYCRSVDAPSDPMALFKLLVLGGVVPALLGSLVGIGLFVAFGLVSFSTTWPAWFAGMTIGTCSVLPIGVVLAQQGWRPVARGLAQPEVAATLLLVLAASLYAPTALSYPYVYIGMALFAAAVVGRFSAAAVAVLVCSVTLGVLMAAGIFQPPPDTSNYSRFSFYLPMLLSLLPSLALGAALERIKLNLADLAERERHYRNLYRKTPVMMHSADVAGALVSVSETWLARLGYAEEEVLGRRFSDFMTAESSRLVNEVSRPNFIEQGQVRNVEHQLLSKTGELVDIRVSAIWERDAAGQPVRSLAVSEDITLQKQAELSLRLALQHAESANAAKSLFLANMSHEIRSPMNAVIGLSHLLGGTRLDVEQSALLQKMRVASRSLLAIINDVLDLSKIEAGELMLEQSNFRLPTLIEDLSSVNSVAAAAKDLHLSVDVDIDLPTTLVGDVTRLGQVLTNLLSNAIKFTEAGEVRLVVQCLHQDATQCQVRFSVFDSGIGISEEALGRLFQPFSQADASTTRRYGGTGLGLSIVKHLVEIQGGRLGVNSTPGQGSEFWVELEFGVAAPIDGPDQAGVADLPKGGGRGIAGVRVLVADDSEINCEVARRILERAGASVITVSDGEAAVQALRAGPSDFDIVLMDVQMPVLDGLEATRRIRAESRFMRLPVVALTAGALASERQRAERAGMNAFVSKPFEPAALVATIESLVAGASEAGKAPPGAAVQDWPEIEGIDSAKASRQLGGDVVLFRSMLKRLMSAFADLRQWDPSQALADLAVLGARMHKLRGSAGVLGATDVLQFAAAAEQACAAADAELAAKLVSQVAVALGALDAALPQEFRLPPDRPAAEAKVALSPQAMRALVEQLRAQDLQAVSSFLQLSVALRQQVGDERFEQLREQMQALDFGKVVEVLDSL